MLVGRFDCIEVCGHFIMTCGPSVLINNVLLWCILLYLNFLQFSTITCNQQLLCEVHISVHNL